MMPFLARLMVHVPESLHPLQVYQTKSMIYDRQILQGWAHPHSYLQVTLLCAQVIQAGTTVVDLLPTVLELSPA